MSSQYIILHKPIYVHISIKCEALLRLGFSARTRARTYVLTSTRFTLNFKTVVSYLRPGFLSIFTYLSIFSLSSAITQIYSVCIPGVYRYTQLRKSEKIKYLCEDGATFFDQYV